MKLALRQLKAQGDSKLSKISPAALPLFVPKSRVFEHVELEEECLEPAVRVLVRRRAGRREERAGRTTRRRPGKAQTCRSASERDPGRRNPGSRHGTPTRGSANSARWMSSHRTFESGLFPSTCGWTRFPGLTLTDWSGGGSSLLQPPRACFGEAGLQLRLEVLAAAAVRAQKRPQDAGHPPSGARRLSSWFPRRAEEQGVENGEGRRIPGGRPDWPFAWFDTETCACLQPSTPGTARRCRLPPPRPPPQRPAGRSARRGPSPPAARRGRPTQQRTPQGGTPTRARAGAARPSPAARRGRVVDGRGEEAVVYTRLARARDACERVPDDEAARERRGKAVRGTSTAASPSRLRLWRAGSRFAGRSDPPPLGSNSLAAAPLAPPASGARAGARPAAAPSRLREVAQAQRNGRLGVCAGECARLRGVVRAAPQPLAQAVQSRVLALQLREEGDGLPARTGSEEGGWGGVGSEGWGSAATE